MHRIEDQNGNTRESSRLTREGNFLVKCVHYIALSGDRKERRHMPTSVTNCLCCSPWRLPQGLVQSFRLYLVPPSTTCMHPGVLVVHLVSPLPNCTQKLLFFPVVRQMTRDSHQGLSRMTPGASRWTYYSSTNDLSNLIFKLSLTTFHIIIFESYHMRIVFHLFLQISQKSWTSQSV
jgi:hypothetical protein